jgi:hypothetical protein
MSTKTLATTTPRNRHELTCLLLPVLPLILLTGLLVHGVMKERQAKSELRAELARLAEQGLPYSNHAVTVAYDRRTDRANSERWHDVFRACSELESRFFNLEMAAESVPFGSDAPIDPDESIPLALQRATESAPVIDLIEKLVEDSVPFWSPRLFDGFQTLLPDVQSMRAPSRLLATEFRAAVELGDPDRALSALHLMLGLADAFDVETALVSELVRIAIINHHRTLIQESLEEGFWTEPQHLSQLHEQLQRKDNLDRLWQRAMNGEWSMMASQLIGDESDDLEWASWYGVPANVLPWGIPATGKLALVRSHLHDPSGTRAGTPKHVHKITKLEKAAEQSSSDSRTRSLVSIPFSNTGKLLLELVRPATASFANAVARYEVERKFTLTAVAIKRFQLQEGRWPSDLAELSKVGLSSNDWSVEVSKPFGYQVVEDNSGADLWGGLYQSAWEIPLVPEKDRNTNEYEGLWVTIR